MLIMFHNVVLIFRDPVCVKPLSHHVCTMCVVAVHRARVPGAGGRGRGGHSHGRLPRKCEYTSSAITPVYNITLARMVSWKFGSV